jgi:lysophospholipase L1-like esterase
VSAFIIALAFTGLSMIPKEPLRVVFFGDSITNQGARKGGYIDLIRNEINQRGLKDQYELIGAGIGGNKVYDLYLRREEDVLAKQPDVVFIYIGINDVWHKTSSGTGTDAPKFAAFYHAIIKKLQDKKIKVILCTPSVIGEKSDCTNPQDGDLNAYAQIIRDIAADHHCELVDLRRTFLDYEAHNNTSNAEKGILTVDRVHLNDTGNKLVADQLLKALIPAP